MGRGEEKNRGCVHRKQRRMGRGGGGVLDRSSGITTRSMSARQIAKSKPRKIRRKKEQTVTNKLYEIPGSGGGRYTYLTPEEYLACEKEHEDFLATSHLKLEPDHAKKRCDLLCRRLFPTIQASRKEMTDYELVEPMGMSNILVWGCWTHMNFKAKRKDADDSSTAIYFVELDMTKDEVTCLAKLDIDLDADNSAYKCCGICDMDPEEMKNSSIGGYGAVYHPLNASWILGGPVLD